MYEWRFLKLRIFLKYDIFWEKYPSRAISLIYKQFAYTYIYLNTRGAPKWWKYPEDYDEGNNVGVGDDDGGDNCQHND